MATMTSRKQRQEAPKVRVEIRKNDIVRVIAGRDKGKDRITSYNVCYTKLLRDAGAVEALLSGKSLLPAGVTSVVGRFGRGEPVVVAGPDRAVLAKGLVRYTADEAHKIAGHRSGEIEKILGYPGRAALIHRDDMVIG